MNFWLLISGLVITALATHDVLFTTFAPNGASHISGRVTSITWKTIHFISVKAGRRSILNGAGIVIICTILLSWVTMIWIGNALIFSADPQAVVHSSTRAAASYTDRIYYAGYVLSTLGIGDFKAGSSGWQIYTAIVSFYGLMLITIAISYMVPVISAVTDRRTLSIQIASLGHCPESILLNHWDGKDFKNLENSLFSLKEKIALHGQLHLSYPILQYFQNNKKITALMPNIVALDEALYILHYLVPEQIRPKRHVLEPMRIIVRSFFDSLATTSSFKEVENIPAIRTEKLECAAVPLLTLSGEQLNELNKRRLFLKSILNNSGWQWKEIYVELQNERFS